MTQEKQNVAIAKLMGWFPTGVKNGYGDEMWGREGGGWEREYNLPKYSESLDLMYEAEMKLVIPNSNWKSPLFDTLEQKWVDEISRASSVEPKKRFGTLLMSSEERAKALLKTFDKWED